MLSLFSTFVFVFVFVIVFVIVSVISDILELPDLSPDLHKLLLRFAESRVAAMSRAQGWEAGPGQLGKVTGEIRRALSVTVVRANALCLFERLSQLGPGARAAAKRRQGTLLLEDRRR